MAELTQLLASVGRGDPQADNAFLQQVYSELKLIANRHLARESSGQTLQPTALVHEVYLRLQFADSKDSSKDRPAWESRTHFFAAASNAMRRILIESARSKRRQKRGGDWKREALDPERIAEPERADDLLALDEALSKLATIEPRIAELVTLRYFGGLTIKEAAELLGISPRTADSDWAYARAWLLTEIQSE